MNHSNEHESHIEMSFHQDKYDAVKSSSVSEAGIINATKKNLERIMLLVSFWNKISVISCMIAVLMDPLFLYTAYLDYRAVCLGTDKRLRYTVLITRSLTDFTFLFHIIHQLREAMKAVIPVSTKRKLVQSGNSKLFNWFGNAKAIAKKLSWSSFLADILAILPIPHVLLALFYAPNYEFSEKKMTLNYILLAQYVPRMYRIFSSSKQLLRKSSSMWVKAAFYFFMYILSSHVIGAFWYFSTVQIELVCWKIALNGTAPIFRCDDTSMSPDPLSNILVHETCKNRRAQNRTHVQFIYGSFRETVTAGKTGSKGFRDKLAYFIWWGLKNLSNFGTDIDPSKFIWENGFAILVSGIGLVLFAFLIGNMQHCMQSSEEKKVATDKVQMKEQELKEWMDNNGLPEKLGKDAEKLKIEMMKKITENLKDDNDAEVQNLFSLLPWNTVKDLKLAICMSLMKKVRRLKDMDERGLRLICHYLKPVTYTENTFAFRMGEPLDRMLFVMEGIMLIYPTSTTTATATDREVRGSPTTIRCSLENGDVYGDEQLMSWASPPDMSNISYAHLPILTENVKCLSEVEGFVLTAKDLKSVVSLYKLRGNINSSVQLVVEVEHSMTSIARGPSTVRRNRIHPSPRPGTEG